MIQHAIRGSVCRDAEGAIVKEAVAHNRSWGAVADGDAFVVEVMEQAVFDERRLAWSQINTVRILDTPISLARGRVF